MNKVIGGLCLVILVGFLSQRSAAGFTSLWVFGDGVCTTTKVHSPSVAALYHENRFCNGRVWVEVLSQWQGLSYVESANNSFYGHNSAAMLANVAAFTAPGDVATALFVAWPSNADFVEFAQVNSPPYDASDEAAWAAFVSDAVDDHAEIVEDLYDKGVRTLLVPTAVDISSVPFFSMGASDSAFIRARTIEFNSALVTMLDGLVPTLSGLKVYVPDTFGFFDDVLTNPGDYGVIDPPGFPEDKIGSGVVPVDFTCCGADYIFWDFFHPTARVQMHLADLMQQTVSPPAISGIAKTGGGFDLTLENVPVGRDGFISGSTNLVDWFQDQAVTSSSITQVEAVAPSGPSRFFRADFPVIWSWP